MKKLMIKLYLKIIVSVGVLVYLFLIKQPFNTENLLWFLVLTTAVVVGLLIQFKYDSRSK